MNRDLRTFALILMIPILSFLLGGWYLEPQIEALISSAGLQARPWSAAAVGIGLLAADSLLPVPSSVVGTCLGAVLGWAAGGVVTWVGLNLGALLGYELARWLGRWWLGRSESDSAFIEVQELRARWGAGALAVCRGVPILAEASVLAAGLYRLPRLGFWAIVAPANLGLAVAYAILGATSAAVDWLPSGLALSLGLPAVALWLLTRRSSFGTRKAI